MDLIFHSYLLGWMSFVVTPISAFFQNVVSKIACIRTLHGTRVAFAIAKDNTITKRETTTCNGNVSICTLQIQMEN